MCLFPTPPPEHERRRPRPSSVHITNFQRENRTREERTKRRRGERDGEGRGQRDGEGREMERGENRETERGERTERTERTGWPTWYASFPLTPNHIQTDLSHLMSITLFCFACGSTSSQLKQEQEELQ